METPTEQADQADTSAHVRTGSIATIQHRPRTKAQGPRFDALPEFRDKSAPAAQPPINASPYPSDPVAKVAALKEPRFGPLFIKYSECRFAWNCTCPCCMLWPACCGPAAPCASGCLVKPQTFCASSLPLLYARIKYAPLFADSSCFAPYRSTHCHVTGTWTGGAAVAWTYLSGFRYLYQVCKMKGNSTQAT